MLRSDTEKDFERIKNKNHIEQILSELDKQVPHYFKSILDAEIEGSNLLGEQLVWSTIINDGIKKFDKESTFYKDFFDEENMEEFEEIDDPKAFKSELRKACPIIRKSLMSKLEEMQDWKEDFMKSKPLELFETFANFLDFQSEYAMEHKTSNYNNFNQYEDFEDLGQFSDDEDLTLRKVIGAGIKTTIIYNLNPKYFCKSVRRTLYGLYFLTEDLHKLTPSRTSEFIMVDDTYKWASARNSKTNLRMEHNYWYPFNLFMLYTNHIYKILEKQFGKLNISLSPDYRFVYVNIFLERICVLHSEAIKTMMGGDQDF